MPTPRSCTPLSLVRLFFLVFFLAGVASAEKKVSQAFSELPAAAQKAFNRNFPRAKIVDIKNTTITSGTEYAIYFVAEKDTLVLTFTQASMLLSSISK